VRAARRGPRELQRFTLFGGALLGGRAATHRRPRRFGDGEPRGAGRKARSQGRPVPEDPANPTPGLPDAFGRPGKLDPTPYPLQGIHHGSHAGWRLRAESSNLGCVVEDS
jgi:hypothetical protein